MNIDYRASISFAALAVSCVIGCGGHVNLGGKGTAGSGSDSAGAGSAAGAPNVPAPIDSSASRPVAKLAEDFSVGTLAVAGDFLYFSGFERSKPGLYRCRKTNCGATRERLSQVSGNIGTLQVYEQRLGVTTVGDGDLWFGSYALPSGSDQQITIRDLPATGPLRPLFYGKFLYFGVPSDGLAYRCALPRCLGGPERIGAALGDTTIHADADLVFWSDWSFIYRAGDFGHAAAQVLLPDDTLSEASPRARSGDESPPDGIAAVAVSDGMLYAAVSHSESGQRCDSFCPYLVARWPAAGGAREVLFTNESIVRNLWIFDGELAWLSGPSEMRNLDAATLSTCRLEACAQTRRDLGQLKADFKALVADEHDLYWLEAEAMERTGSGNTSFADRQIRSASRLPPAQP